MKNLSRPLVIFDLETTGVETHSARIVEIAAVKIGTDGSVLKKFETLVNPGQDIPFKATSIHGISNEMVKSSPRFFEIVKQVSSLMDGCDVGGFNIISYDWPLLTAEVARSGQPFPIPNIGCLVDAIPIFRTHKLKAPHTLDAAWNYYCPEKVRLTAHWAMGDVRATYAVLRAQQQADDWESWEQYMGKIRGLYADSECRILKEDLTVAFGKWAGMPLARLKQVSPQTFNWFWSTFPECDQHLFGGIL